MKTDIKEYPNKKIIHTIALLFVLLTAAIIANALYTSIIINRDMLQHQRIDTLGRLNIARAVHNNQLEKLKTISLIAKEQNQKYCQFLDYDNVKAISYMLKSLVSIYDTDIAVVLNENDQIITAYPKHLPGLDRHSAKLLIGSGTSGVSLSQLPAELIARLLPHLKLHADQASSLCFRAVTPLIHDTGDHYGYVILLKMINGNRRLIDHMSRVSESQVIYFDKDRSALLSSFGQSMVPFPEDKKLSVGGQKYMTAAADLLNENGALAAYLVVAHNQAGYYAQRRKLMIGTLSPLIMTAFASIALFILLKQRIFNKVHLLSRALRDVSGDKEDMGIRVPVGQNTEEQEPKDEIEYMCLDFNRMMATLEHTYSQMLEAREEAEVMNQELEKRVKERTAQISVMYDDLKIEMEERQQAVEKQRSLEKSLERARKMEAIGTLAGGVAHDLNNILSSLINYPELILLDLPPDSPLKEPVTTIKTSGERAASIVQDLLTLARRGVANTEPLCINTIISDYLTSPEYKELCSSHPHVTLEAQLSDDILTLSGSAIHLSKAIMNLVSNAAEAMPDGGTIEIRTCNRYIDFPIKGYDVTPEGEYVMVQISDDGIGISEKDLERIFEPFFTKKILGRSGTGLGMSVVWGTVEDHKGYIDVLSQEGQGTIFSLYFPATHERPASVQQETYDLKALEGNQQTVLIVDDIKEQLDVASKMVTRLGYRTVTASSGQDAILFLKQNHADVLILDMLMPEMDGLETYEQIIEFKPDQKVIIASGYSETQRVKKAQRLGVREYVKKPYTMQRIGQALKTQLD